jgi:uncharacterized membrane protein YfcA
MLPLFTPSEWLMALIAATGVGVSKSGLPGISLFHVVVFASLFPGAASTGVVLPMLIAGDVGAVWLFRRNAQWVYVLRTLPPALVGVAVGWYLMGRLPGAKFGPLIGGIVLTLALLQLVRHWRPGWFNQVPHSIPFAWTMGFLAGVTTMMANAAGPVMALYLLAVSLPKDAFIGTGAWFFLILNLLKVPFSLQLGLISGSTLTFNVLMLPCIVGGLFLGRHLVARLPQKWFDSLVLVLALVAAARLMFGA